MTFNKDVEGIMYYREPIDSFNEFNAGTPFGARENDVFAVFIPSNEYQTPINPSDITMPDSLVEYKVVVCRMRQADSPKTYVFCKTDFCHSPFVIRKSEDYAYIVFLGSDAVGSSKINRLFSHEYKVPLASVESQLNGSDDEKEMIIRDLYHKATENRSTSWTCNRPNAVA